MTIGAIDADEQIADPVTQDYVMTLQRPFATESEAGRPGFLVPIPHRDRCRGRPDVCRLRRMEAIKEPIG
jgi:hypothetical protein